jgi:hypothetical protein
MITLAVVAPGGIGSHRRQRKGTAGLADHQRSFSLVCFILSAGLAFLRNPAQLCNEISNLSAEM